MKEQHKFQEKLQSYGKNEKDTQKILNKLKKQQQI